MFVRPQDCSPCLYLLCHPTFSPLHILTASPSPLPLSLHILFQDYLPLFFPTLHPHLCVVDVYGSVNSQVSHSVLLPFSRSTITSHIIVYSYNKKSFIPHSFLLAILNYAVLFWYLSHYNICILYIPHFLLKPHYIPHSTYTCLQIHNVCYLQTSLYPCSCHQYFTSIFWCSYSDRFPKVKKQH